MRVKYSKPRGKRVNHSTVKVIADDINIRSQCTIHRIPVYVGIEIHHSDEVLWWLQKQHKWGSIDEAYEDESYSSMRPGIHSVKAALRHISKHPEITDGSEIKLVSNFVGHDVYIIK